MQFRIARHTHSLKVMVDFYCGILGLRVLGSFKNHSGYDGVFIGQEHQNWHLEFTVSHDKPTHTFDEDDALVLYPSTMEEYYEMASRISKNSKTIRTKNPYWLNNGVAVKDPDGFIVIVRNQKAKGIVHKGQL